MDPVSATPAHLLLHKKEQADNHSVRKTEEGAASAFASYGFGPLDEPGKAKESKPVSGIGLGQNMLSAHSLSWVTAVQETSSGAGGQKTA
jgi:hypothetical protein